MREDAQTALVTSSLNQLHLSVMARDCEALAREAEQRGLGYLGYLQALLEGEVAHRQEQQLRQRLKAAAFPYAKRLEDFDFSLVPSVPKTRLLELAQGAFLATHDNVLFIGRERDWQDAFTHGIRPSVVPGGLSGPVPPGGDVGDRVGSGSSGVPAPPALGPLPAL